MNTNIRYYLFSMLTAFSVSTALAAKLNTQTFVFECNTGDEFVVDIGDGGNWLFLKQQTLKLKPPRGLAAYTAPGLELQMHDGSAILREEGKTTLICQNNRKRAIWEHAKLSGVDFRATGNEPAWVLEFIDGDALVYRGDGNTRIEQPLPEAISDTASRTSRWKTDKFSIKIQAIPCKDSMSGESFESSVTIFIENHELKGCGRALH